MGRGKIEIKKIENANSRQVTFSKRRSGLFKKAHELAVLCEADVAVIIFSNTGRLFDFSSTSMRNILSRYKRCLEITKAPPRSLEYRPQRQEPEESKEADILKQEIEKLKLKQMRLLGKSLDGMDLLELGALEQQLSEGLIYIKQRKEEALMQQLEHYRDQEQKIMLENETLRKQVQELQAFFPSTSSPSMLCIEHNATVEKTDPVIKEGSGSPEMACDGGIADDEELADDEDSDTTLQLGPPTRICRKRKTMDGETQSLRLD